MPVQVSAGGLPLRTTRPRRRRPRTEPEFELLDSGVFEDNRYFDVFVEYAKAGPEDICIRITAVNRGPETASLELLPTLWFRNTWSWDYGEKPCLSAESSQVIRCEQDYIGVRKLFCEAAQELLFTENETNFQRVYGSQNPSPYVKDGINDYIVNGRRDAVNPQRIGTKAAARYPLELRPGESKVVRLRFTDGDRAFEDFDQVFASRIAEADEFYAPLAGPDSSDDLRSVQRQGFAGMLWSKQFYCYDVNTWLHGDPGQPAAAARTAAWAQFRLDASLQRRHHLDAR